MCISFFSFFFFFFSILRAPLAHVCPINFETDVTIVKFFRDDDTRFHRHNFSVSCFSKDRYHGDDVTGKSFDEREREKTLLVKPRHGERSLIRLAIKRNWKIKQPLTRKLNFAKSTLAIFINWQKLDIYRNTRPRTRAQVRWKFSNAHTSGCRTFV